jgi:hypothetical protein
MSSESPRTPGESGPLDPHHLVSRNHVIRVLTRTGMPVSDAEQAISGISFPAELELVRNHLGNQGITQDELMSRLGGSP